MLKRLLALFLLLPLLAAAQITPGTQCGAPGVGYVPNREGRPVMQARAASQAVGTRVAADGYWTLCDMATARKPRIPSGCNLPAELTWRRGDLLCRGAGISIEHGRIGSVVSSEHRGVYVAQCSDGQVTELLSTCEERTDCEGSASLSDDGRATVWAWSGRLRDGERGTATAPDGRTRAVECRRGKLGLM